MKKCESCGATIAFGGKKEGRFHFCNDRCFNKGGGYTVYDDVPEDEVDDLMLKVHQGACPLCQGPGPVDIHMSYEIWAILFWTSVKSIPRICCQPCGQKKRMVALLGSMFLGWWSIPTGIIMTPIQIARNIAGLVDLPDDSMPSIELENDVRMELANDLYKSQKGLKKSE